MEVIEYLRSHTLEELTATYGVAVKRHPAHPSLVMLKYSQSESPMAEPIVQECRGLILDEANDWRVVSYPYRKFFNHGEGHAAPVDWNTARVYDKLDGSLMTLYHYEDEWRVASSGMPDAGGPVYGNTGMSFADLFWKTWKAHGYCLPDNELYCFMFELMTPHNRIVVPHTTSRLVLHGVRYLPTLAEVDPESVADEHGWQCVTSYPLNTLAGILAAAESLDPMQAEGYVVCDANFNRLKVKSPQYVALAHMKEGMGVRAMLDVVRRNESSEFLVHFPEWREAYEHVRGEFDATCNEIEADYARLASIPIQKDFALEAVKTRCSAALFAIRDGKVKSAREFFAVGTVQAVERTVKIDEAKLLAIKFGEAA